MRGILTSEMGVGGMSKDGWSNLIYFLHPWTVSHRVGPTCYLARNLYRLAWARDRKIRGASKDEGNVYARRLTRYLCGRVASVGAFRVFVRNGKLWFLLRTWEFRKMTRMGRIVVRLADSVPEKRSAKRDTRKPASCGGAPIREKRSGGRRAAGPSGAAA
jgi:hypothetical protein